jgi:V8-like Glu-specific endopeptidase
MPRPRPRLLAALAPLCGALAACAGPPAPGFTLARRPIIGGSADTTHAAVVAIVVGGPGMGGYQQFCTGTVIAPRAVLSAGHCIAESGYLPSDIRIYFGDIVTTAGQAIQVTAAYVHPDYVLGADGIPLNDVSVLMMAEDAPVTPMQWQRQTLPDLTGQPVLLVGYGVTDAAAQNGNGTRRAVEQTVTSQDAMFVYYHGHNDGTCQGDSGGPMIVTTSGIETVVAVTSYGDQTCVASGANTRVDAYVDFITQYAGTGPGPVAVTITSPPNDATRGPSFTVDATITSGAGVASAALLVDGTVVLTALASPWSFPVADLAPGAHQLTVVGHGVDGGAGQATVQLIVSATGTGGGGYELIGGCRAAGPRAADGAVALLVLGALAGRRRRTAPRPGSRDAE